jgi:hypothetical protein
MTLTVRERADTIGTLRFLSVHVMETLARWVPTTPDLEAKIVFGRHLWEFAQHADLLGKRTHELRAALHYSPAPAPDYLAALESWRALESAADRVCTCYDAILPDLERRYRAFLESTDRFLDEPSVRVVERALADFPRMREEAATLRRERPDLARGGAAADALAKRLAACGEYVVFRAPVATAAERLA